MTDQSDEPLGLAALVLALWFGWCHRQDLVFRPVVMTVGALALLALGWMGTPPLLLGVFAVLSFAASCDHWPGRSGLTALLVLSLPLMASLDFYAGYPMRLAAAGLTHGILSVCGLAVERSGVLLLEAGQIVGVDPPCSGVRMLWTSLLTAAVLSTRSQINGARRIVLLALSIAFVVFGNGMRSTILFFPESGHVHWAHWTHEAVGLVVHLLVLAAIFAATTHLQHRPQRKAAAPWHPFSIKYTAVAALALTAAAMVHAAAEASEVIPQTSSVPWPETWDGVPLIPLPLSERELRFARAFPGQIGSFRCGQAEIILRRVNRPTRMLHSSADCLRAAGFEVEPKPVLRDEDGRVWGRAEARYRGVQYQMRERITSASTQSASTDVSGWYWAAAMRPSEGPWLAVTILEPVP